MSAQRAAFLPDGVEELLPDAAWMAEDLRRRLLDHYRERGYGLILPPLVEHLDSLLVGAGEDLEEQTFRFVDPASGRMLGVRADMTPQAARIAATRFPADQAVRLCYLGSVLRTHPDTPGGARAPRQVGCELFGDASLEGDMEVLDLMIGTLSLAGVREPLVDLGHIGIYSHLLADCALKPADEHVLFDILQRKCVPELGEWLRATGLPAATRDALTELIELHGPPEQVLPAAREALPDSEPVKAALLALETVSERLQANPAIAGLHIDLSELRGYRYQTGLSYAAFGSGSARELARGGRYDGIGDIYGAPRPATGFSADLNELLALG
ncbi:ATP phosphoribosyltransferase regulatory subunit [Algiphilus sp.]|uniref:ATP phosphoribosyltransferase regulatory subunit n=3 Tax=Algiphilus sp. TaxID=1872431 RepID=UPI0025C2CF3D|nr:ATP phosphoribosyltransferase regulatory subunit [Algiphilus sp.]